MWVGLVGSEEGVNVMFEADPCEKGDAEDKVKEAFVRDGQDDEDR